MSGGEEKRTPGAGQQTGGTGENENDHSNIIHETIPADAARTDQKDLLPDADASVSFLEAWRPGGPWVLTAIEVDGGQDAPTPTATLTTTEAVWRWIHDHSGGRWNLYFTPNVTRGPVRKKPKKADMEEAVALFCDVDPRAGEPLDPERARIARLFDDWEKDGKKLPFPRPTVTIDSGGGMQGFFILREPVGLNSPDVVAEVEARGAGIKVAVEGDGVQNVDRVMRLCGTVNWPNGKKRKAGRVPRLARVVDDHWDRRYSLEDFPKVNLKPAGSRSHPATRVELPKDLPPVSLDDLPAAVTARTKMLIVEGDDPDDANKYPSRSEVLFAVLCEMARAGCEREQMAAVVMDPDHKISAHVHDQSRPHDYVERQIERAEAETEVPELAEMNARHAFVTYGNKGRVAFEQEGKAVRFIEKQTLFDKYANRKVEVGTDKEGNAVMKPLGKWWFEHPQRREFDQVEFVPGTEAPADTYNLWRGPAVTPALGDCSLYMELVRKVVASDNDEVAEYLLNWMALRVQRPGDKMETSIALRGGQGLGKSVFAERFGDLFGPHFVAVTEMKQLVGNFNAHLQHALLVFGDEVEASHNPAFIGRLKTMVTQPRIRIEPKGVDSFDAPNSFALILAANSPHIISTDADDRRYLVLDVAEARKKDHAFFRALRAQWEDGGKEAFAHHLMNRDLSNFEHRNKPRTSADDDVAEMSFTGAERIIHDMMRSGETPPVEREGALLSSAYDSETGQVFLNAGDVALRAQRRGRWNTDGVERAVGRLLVKLSGAPKATRESVHGRQMRGSWLPPLPDARRRWCEMQDRSFEWGDGDDACWDVVKLSDGKKWEGSEPPF